MPFGRCKEKNTDASGLQLRRTKEQSTAPSGGVELQEKSVVLASACVSPRFKEHINLSSLGRGVKGQRQRNWDDKAERADTDAP